MKNSSGRDSYSVPMLFLFVPGYFWKLSYFTLFDSTASLPCFSMTWTYIYIPFELSYSKISKYFSENQEQGRTPTLARWVGELFSSFSQNSSLLFPGLTSELLFFFFPFMGSFICWFDADPDPCMNCFFLFIKKIKIVSSSKFLLSNVLICSVILIHYSLSFDLQAFIHYALSSVRSSPSCISHRMIICFSDLLGSSNLWFYFAFWMSRSFLVLQFFTCNFNNIMVQVCFGSGNREWFPLQKSAMSQLLGPVFFD